MTRPQIISWNKDPEADLDYAVDWTDWLEAGDTIASSTWALPGGPDGTLENHTSSNTDTQAITWFRRGVLGTTYTVVNRITTAQGRTEDQTVSVYIQDH